MAQSFKTLIFLTIPLNVFILVLVCTSLATQYWVIGSADRNDSSIEFNFGLFGGQKNLQRSGALSDTIKIVCQAGAGVCMFSCGKDSDSRENDLTNLVSDSPCSNSVSSDNLYCRGVGQSCQNANFSTNTADPRDSMLRYGSFVSVLFFISVGLIFTIVTFVFSIINSFSNPIDMIKSVHGLVIWNGGGVLCYFLAMTIWGGEFEYGVKSVTPISDVLRPTGPGGTNWNDLVQSSLGYSYWLIFLAFVIHSCNLGLVIYYIRKRFKPKRSKTVEPKAGSNGNEMLF